MPTPYEDMIARREEAERRRAEILQARLQEKVQQRQEALRERAEQEAQRRQDPPRPVSPPPFDVGQWEQDYTRDKGFAPGQGNQENRRQAIANKLFADDFYKREGRALTDQEWQQHHTTNQQPNSPFFQSYLSRADNVLRLEQERQPPQSLPPLPFTPRQVGGQVKEVLDNLFGDRPQRPAPTPVTPAPSKRVPSLRGIQDALSPFDMFKGDVAPRTPTPTAPQPDFSAWSRAEQQDRQRPAVLPPGEMEMGYSGAGQIDPALLGAPLPVTPTTPRKPTLGGRGKVPRVGVDPISQEMAESVNQDTYMADLIQGRAPVMPVGMQQQQQQAQAEAQQQAQQWAEIQAQQQRDAELLLQHPDATGEEFRRGMLQGGMGLLTNVLRADAALQTLPSEIPADLEARLRGTKQMGIVPPPNTLVPMTGAMGGMEGGDTPESPQLPQTWEEWQALPAAKPLLGSGFSPQGLVSAQGNIWGEHLADQLTNPMAPRRMVPSVTAKDMPGYQLADAVDAQVQEGADERYQDSFWFGAVPQGLGSTLPIMAASAVAPPLGLALGATSGAGSAYDEAATAQEQGFRTPAWRKYAGALAGAFVGASEGLPFMKGGLGERFTNPLLRAIGEGIEEGAQEYVQTMGENVIARDIAGYDPERDYTEGAGEASAAGGVSGFLLNLLTGGLARGANWVRRPKPAPAPPSASATKTTTPFPGQTGAIASTPAVSAPPSSLLTPFSDAEFEQRTNNQWGKPLDLDPPASIMEAEDGVEVLTFDNPTPTPTPRRSNMQEWLALPTASAGTVANVQTNDEGVELLTFEDGSPAVNTPADISEFAQQVQAELGEGARVPETPQQVQEALQDNNPAPAVLLLQPDGNLTTVTGEDAGIDFNEAVVSPKVAIVPTDPDTLEGVETSTIDTLNQLLEQQRDQYAAAESLPTNIRSMEQARAKADSKSDTPEALANAYNAIPYKRNAWYRREVENVKRVPPFSTWSQEAQTSYGQHLTGKLTDAGTDPTSVYGQTFDPFDPANPIGQNRSYIKSTIQRLAQGDFTGERYQQKLRDVLKYDRAIYQASGGLFTLRIIPPVEARHQVETSLRWMLDRSNPRYAQLLQQWANTYNLRIPQQGTAATIQPDTTLIQEVQDAVGGDVGASQRIVSATTAPTLAAVDTRTGVVVESESLNMGQPPSVPTPPVTIQSPTPAPAPQATTIPVAPQGIVYRGRTLSPESAYAQLDSLYTTLRGEGNPLGATPDQWQRRQQAAERAYNELNEAVKAWETANPEEAQTYNVPAPTLSTPTPVAEPAPQAEETVADEPLAEANTEGVWVKLPVPSIDGPNSVASNQDYTTDYQVEYKVVGLDSLVVSNLDNGQRNPAYPQQLQPRDRTKDVSQKVTDQRAKDLAPGALLNETNSIASGSPIIGKDMAVESGNGRTMAMRLARRDVPERWNAYQGALRGRMGELGMDTALLDTLKDPVLVRVRITPVDRVQFAKEANESPLQTMSPAEQAATDVGRISDMMVANLTVGENQAIDAALRAALNQGLVKQFIGNMSGNEAAQLLTADGDLNRVGLQRLKTALFLKTYPGEAGLRLTTAFSEAVDSNIRNLENAMFASLPQMATAEGLIRAGLRDPQLSLADDISKAADIFNRLKNEGVKVSDYVGQMTMFERELTPFQEQLLLFLNETARSPKAVREFLQGYAKAVENEQPLQQSSMFEEVRATKDEIVARLAPTSKALADSENRQIGFDLTPQEEPSNEQPAQPAQNPAPTPEPDPGLVAQSAAADPGTDTRAVTEPQQPAEAGAARETVAPTSVPSTTSVPVRGQVAGDRGGMVDYEVTFNAEKNGIEVRNSGKPKTTLIADLKSAGFRWGGKQKVWYAPYTEARWNQAIAPVTGEQTAPVPVATPDPDPLPNATETPVDTEAVVENAPAVDATLPKRVSKLRQVAERLMAKANENLNRDRLTNTPKRAREAGYQEEAARNELRIAQTLHNIADALEAGEVSYLQAIASKAQVGELEKILIDAQYNTVKARKLRYEQRDNIPWREAIPYAKLPYPYANRSDIKAVADSIRGKPGTKAMVAKADAFSTRMINIQESGDYLTATSDIAWMRALVAKAEALPKPPYEVKNIKERLARYDRVLRIGVENDSDLQAALIEYLPLRATIDRSGQKIKEMERALIGQNIPGYFPTPTVVVQRLLELADIQPGQRVLEPSAGKGNIADALKAAGATVDTIEYQYSLREILKAKGHTVVDSDFMEFTPAAPYDRIVMNPPFENGQDIEHVQRAYTHLKPGGVMTAIMSEGSFSRGDRQAVNFREWLEEVEGESEKLAGAFKQAERSTGVATRIVTIRKSMDADVSAQPATQSPASTIAEPVAQEEVVPPAMAEPEATEAAEVAPTPTDAEIAQAESKEGQITDFGEKIGGARKDTWKARQMVATDLSVLTEREAVEYTTKDNIWHKPDYEALVADGVPTGIVYLIKQVRDSLPVRPTYARATAEDADAKNERTREAYLEGVQRIRDAALTMRTAEDARNLFNTVFPAYNYHARRVAERDRAVVNAIGNKVWKAIQLSNWDIAKAQVDADKQGFPAKREAWQVRYEIRPPAGTDGKWVVLRKSNFRTLGRYDSEADAIAVAKAASGGKGKAQQSPDAEPLTEIVREGPDYRNGQDVSESQFMEAFGFRGGEFGNWTNQADRQLSLNHAYDALMDLSRALNLPPRALSLNGELGIAFGARGKGKAAAHYEPTKVVINLTKTSGAGTLAHEWAHAIDDYFGRVSGDKDPQSPFVSSGVTSTSRMREEVRMAWNGVMDAIKKQPRPVQDVIEDANTKLARLQPRYERVIQEVRGAFDKGNKGVVPTDEQVSEFSRLAALIPYNRLDADTSLYAHTRLDQLVQQVTGKPIKKEWRDQVSQFSFWMGREYKRIEEAQGGTSKEGIATQYYKEAQQQDSPTRKPYWATPHELFARALESYILDTLTETAERSDYLVRPDKAPATAPVWKLWGYYPYPLDTERTTINGAIAEWVSTLKTQATDTYDTALYSLQALAPERIAAQYSTWDALFNEVDSHYDSEQDIVFVSPELLYLTYLNGSLPPVAGGVFRSEANLKEVVEALEAYLEVDNYPVVGPNGQYAGKRTDVPANALPAFERLIENINQAGYRTGTFAPFAMVSTAYGDTDVVQTTVFHERFHVHQERVGVSATLEPREMADILLATVQGGRYRFAPAMKSMLDRMAEAGYRDQFGVLLEDGGFPLNPTTAEALDTALAEVTASIADGKYQERYGLSVEDAATILDHYFNALANVAGIEALDQFVRTREHVARSQERVRNVYQQKQAAAGGQNRLTRLWDKLAGGRADDTPRQSMAPRRQVLPPATTRWADKRSGTTRHGYPATHATTILPGGRRITIRVQVDTTGQTLATAFYKPSAKGSKSVFVGGVVFDSNSAYLDSNTPATLPRGVNGAEVMEVLYQAAVDLKPASAPTTAPLPTEQVYALTPATYNQVGEALEQLEEAGEITGFRFNPDRTRVTLTTAPNTVSRVSGGRLPAPLNTLLQNLSQNEVAREQQPETPPPSAPTSTADPSVPATTPRRNIGDVLKTLSGAWGKGVVTGTIGGTAYLILASPLGDDLLKVEWDDDDEDALPHLSGYLVDLWNENLQTLPEDWRTDTFWTFIRGLGEPARWSQQMTGLVALANPRLLSLSLSNNRDEWSADEREAVDTLAGLIATKDKLSDTERRALLDSARLAYSGPVAMYNAYLALKDVPDRDPRVTQALLNEHENWVSSVVGEMLVDPTWSLSFTSMLNTPRGAGSRLWRQWRSAVKVAGITGREANLGRWDRVADLLTGAADVFRLPATKIDRATRAVSTRMMTEIGGAQTVNEVLDRLFRVLDTPAVAAASDWAGHTFRALDARKTVDAIEAMLRRDGALHNLPKAREIAERFIYDRAHTLATQQYGEMGGFWRGLQGFVQAVKRPLSFGVLLNNPGYLITNALGDYGTALTDGGLARGVSLSGFIPFNKGAAINKWWQEVLGMVPRGANPDLYQATRPSLLGRLTGMSTRTQTGLSGELTGEAIRGAQVFTAQFQHWFPTTWRVVTDNHILAQLPTGVTPAQGRELANALRGLWRESDVASVTGTWAARHGIPPTFMENTVLPAFRSAQNGALHAAQTARDITLLNYADRTYMDVVLDAMMPYQFWATHSIPEWIGRVLDHPKLASGYGQIKDALRDGLNGDAPEADYMRDGIRFSAETVRGIVDTVAPGSDFLTTNLSDPDGMYVDIVSKVINLEQVFSFLPGVGYQPSVDEEERPWYVTALQGFDRVPVGKSPLFEVTLQLLQNAGAPIPDDLADPSIPLHLTRPLRALTTRFRDEINGALEGMGVDARIPEGGVDLNRTFRESLGAQPYTEMEMRNIRRVLAEQVRTGTITQDDMVNAIRQKDTGVWAEAVQIAATTTGDKGLFGWLTSLNVQSDPFRELNHNVREAQALETLYGYDSPQAEAYRTAHPDVAATRLARRDTDDSRTFTPDGVTKRATEWIKNEFEAGRMSKSEAMTALTERRGVMWERALQQGRTAPTSTEPIEGDSAQQGADEYAWFNQLSRYQKRQLRLQVEENINSDDITVRRQAEEVLLVLQKMEKGESLTAADARLLANERDRIAGADPQEQRRIETERRVEELVNRRYPTYRQLEEQYYALTADQRATFLKGNPTLKAAWDLKAAHLESSGLFPDTEYDRRAELTKYPVDEKAEETAGAWGIDSEGMTRYEVYDEVERRKERAAQAAGLTLAEAERLSRLYRDLKERGGEMPESEMEKLERYWDAREQQGYVGYEGSNSTAAPSSDTRDYAESIGIDTEGMTAREAGDAIDNKRQQVADFLGYDLDEIERIEAEYREAKAAGRRIPDSEYQMLSNYWNRLYVN